MREVNRAQGILQLFSEAAIVLDAPTQARVRNITSLFTRTLRDWYRDTTSQLPPTAPRTLATYEFIERINAALAAQRETGVRFEFADEEDLQRLITGGSYGRDALIRIKISYIYAFPATFSTRFATYIIQQIRATLVHEFLHQEQKARRVREINPGYKTALPSFGLDAYAGSKRVNAPIRAQAREERRKPTRDELRHPAKSLTRRSRHPFPHFRRDTTHTRHDPQRRKGMDDPRQKTGREEYYGHPEELMAYAADFAEYARESRRKYPKDAREHARNLADYYYRVVAQHVGQNSPAFKLWLKYVYQYLSPTFSNREITLLLFFLKFQPPGLAGVYRERLPIIDDEEDGDEGDYTDDDDNNNGDSNGNEQRKR